MHIKNKTSRGYKKQLILQNEIPPHEIYVHNLINPNTPPPLSKGTQNTRASAEYVIYVNIVYKIRSIQVVTEC